MRLQVSESYPDSFALQESERQAKKGEKKAVVLLAAGAQLCQSLSFFEGAVGGNR